jgi:hypothetical protein
MSGGRFDEDADLRANLASLIRGAIADLERVLEARQTYRDACFASSSHDRNSPS